MTRTLEHRGPDDVGHASGDGWAVGMRRLAIQDTSEAGHQPMRFGDLTIVFNGEVYNFDALRRELEGHGHRFCSASDTEVVLHALAHWGTGALERFNGMFALVVVDARRRRAWLARDRFGKKPLFVARLKGRLAFASELKAIMTVARDELSVSRRALAAYFRFQYVPTPSCIFEQVTKLPAASWAEVDLSSGRCSEPHRFWSLPEPRESTPSTPEEILDVITQAVARRLVADVPVGAFLSGGTDSSLVVAGMRAASSDVRTFSIGFRDPRFDESRYALAVARHLQTDHTHLQLEPSDALALVPGLSDAYDEPFADSSAIPTMAVARLAREHVTVALSGDGGDELFGGYTRYRLARPMRWVRMIPAPAAGALEKTLPRRALGWRIGLLTSLAQASSDAEAYEDLVSVWRSNELGGLMPDSGLDPSFLEHWTPAAGAVESMMRCDAGTYLIDDILQKVDRATMSVGLEARNPLLDPDVVSLGLDATGLAEAAPGRKPLLKAALKLRLPNGLVDRPKMGFGVPVGEWMRREMRQLVEDLVISRRSAEYDVDVAREVCHAHLSGARDATPHVWSLLAYEMWRERWLSSSGVAAVT